MLTKRRIVQLVRILTGMPLGSVDQRSPCVMVNILGTAVVEGAYRLEGAGHVLGIPDAHFYWYGKTSTTDRRKMGHVTVLDKSIEEADMKADTIFQNLVLKRIT